MSLRIHSRRCPECASPMLGEAGRVWLTCPECPIALHAGTGERVATCRPEGERGARGPRLPFWLFAAEARTIWVAAFRCFNQPQRPDVDRLLTGRGHAPPLVEAPLGSRVARSPEEARALAAALEPVAPPPEAPRLVSLAVRAESDGTVVEPLTGWRVLAGLIVPKL